MMTLPCFEATELVLFARLSIRHENQRYIPVFFTSNRLLGKEKLFSSHH